MSERDDEPREGAPVRPAEGVKLSPEAERARGALHAAPPLRADPAFRERLKQEFVSGAIEVTGSRVRRARSNGDAARAEAGRRHTRGRSARAGGAWSAG